MAKAYKIYIWKKAPMLRLVLPLIVGIILELQFNFRSGTIIVFASFVLSAYFVFSLLPLAYYFRFQATAGIMVTAFTIAVGSFLTWQKDIRNHASWYGNFYDSSSYIIATIIEPPVEKNKSYKALAEVDGIIKE